MTESPAPELAFVPVPLARARHDGWSAARQRMFIEQLSRIGLVSAAARAVGMSAKSAYALRKRPGAESFAAAWDEAVGLGQFLAQAAAIHRAVDGEVRPVFYRGRQVGERRVYNDRLLIAVLNAQRLRKVTPPPKDVP
ncbi:hypothetical protein GON01_09640 [Sphingomonas sp. MAH-20]|uniref:Uncharacterized protein n=1 Tax=Sphingomonas horti TaxID=2682842 RepID=A0A6I4J1B2_9SPHN|nr:MULTISPECIES: hypothetical protein [Sphingomonas]MBA2919314.1 hypothetical protein [Sphingomonas sp. CGMCC 1.13658]MVO78195.1 hypothetical protein [Sphingomonas horti]